MKHQPAAAEANATLPGERKRGEEDGGRKRKTRQMERVHRGESGVERQRGCYYSASV